MSQPQVPEPTEKPTEKPEPGDEEPGAPREPEPAERDPEAEPDTLGPGRP